MKIENKYKVLQQNTCPARPGNRRQRGYTEAVNRLNKSCNAKPCEIMKTEQKLKLNRSRIRMNLNKSSDKITKYAYPGGWTPKGH